MKGVYKCTCGSITFHLANSRRAVGSEIRLEPVLSCTSCNRYYGIDPCNTNGLTLVKS